MCLSIKEPHTRSASMNPAVSTAAIAATSSLPPADEPAWAAWSALLAAAGLGVSVKDADSGRYLLANDTLLGWMERDAGAVVGRTDGELFDATTHGALRTADQMALAQEGVSSGEHRVNLGGGLKDLSLCRIAVAGPGGARRLLSLWTDLGVRRQHESQARAALGQIEQLQSAIDLLRRELADQALRDSASGLYAKAHFEDQLRREVDLSSREHREFSIVFVEIDEAREAGPLRAPGLSAVQAALGRLLRGGTRAMDAACRLDDRRFAVLLSGVGLATAHSRMEGLRRRCATEIVVHEGRETRFTVSMGVASFPHTAHNQAELLDACAAALREAQRRGGNHVALAAIRFEST